jgi:hypothetical protein
MMDREKIEMEIADLRRARGFALLHGKKYDDAPIIKLQNQLDALADIEAARTQEVLEQSAKATEAEITAARTEIQDLKSASARALADSRGAYARGAANMRLHLQTEASLRKAQAKLNQLTGENAPIVNQFELERKRSLQIAQVGLKAINNHPSKFGVIQWPMTLSEWK